jgi:hypothetical protein
METVWSESLTSYMNRLGWQHGVSPRALAAQEMGLFLLMLNGGITHLLN